MKALSFLLESSLSSEDAVALAKAVSIWDSAVGKQKCWCLKKTAHSVFSGFSTARKQNTLYKGQDARVLMLALSGRYPTEECPVLVRRSCCGSTHCLNPVHYYYGTRSDVAMETRLKNPKANKNQSQVTPSVVENLKRERDAGETILRLSRKYKLPYHVARRICSEDTYSSQNGIFTDKYIDRLWERVFENCLEICKNNPTDSRSYNLAYHVTDQLTCPWHRKGSDAHKGNFGLMGECLDCMEEIKAGRCSVDVKNFDFQWYWQVKRFWEQVDVRGPSECWPWLGATRRDNKESIAYFPSPFHSAKTQSAPRVAFWLSRGYTGKYRIFNKPECQAFCCNPTHLTIRELKGSPQPNEITEICLNHGNIFQHYREADPKDQPSPAV